MVAITCGIDWAEGHHDIALVDDTGKLVAKARISDDPEGYAQLIGMLTAAGDRAADPIPVAIETPRGLLVATLHGDGRPVYPINPLAVARYRDRISVAGRKSDHGDALVLANILRTDRHLHRPLPDDSDDARKLTILARAHQDATWRRVTCARQLRSLLREYFPAFQQAVGQKLANLCSAEARALLAAAPTPWQAAAMTPTLLENTLRRAGRSRYLAERAAHIHHAFAQPQLRQPRPIEDTFGEQAHALLETLDAECATVDHLSARIGRAFRLHPDYRIITSFPGLADITGARILAEIGDDPTRFATARGLKAFAGCAPITRASGRTTTVAHRVIKNRRLAATGGLWASIAAMTYPPAKAHYQYRRVAGDTHHAALRNLFNKMLGQLYACLRDGRTFQEEIAWPACAIGPIGRFGDDLFDEDGFVP